MSNQLIPSSAPILRTSDGCGVPQVHALDGLIELIDKLIVIANLLGRGDQFRLVRPGVQFRFQIMIFQQQTPLHLQIGEQQNQT